MTLTCIRTMTQQFIHAFLYRLFILVLAALQVLEAEPWNTKRHGRNTGKAWVECGERVPAYLENLPSTALWVRTAKRVSHGSPAVRTQRARRSGRGSGRSRINKLAADPHYRENFTRPTEDAAHGEPGTPQQQQERERGEPCSNTR